MPPIVLYMTGEGNVSHCKECKKNTNRCVYIYFLSSYITVDITITHHSGMNTSDRFHNSGKKLAT